MLLSAKNKMKSKLLFVLLLFSSLQYFGDARQLTLELHSNAEEKVQLGQSFFELALNLCASVIWLFCNKSVKDWKLT